MCTLVVLRRPDHDWPLLLAANRDERHDRPSKEPGHHWPDRPEVVAGLDVLAGGSWLGINDDGVVAAILNREGTLGPAEGKRSRGELVLDALDFADAADAAAALATLNPNAYRPFNLVVADSRDAFLLVHRNEGDRPIQSEPLQPGLTMITAMERDDQRSPRIRLYRPRFLAAAPPDPDKNEWSDWEALLASRAAAENAGPSGALYIAGLPPDDPGRFGTVSSSLIALPGLDFPARRPIWRFAGDPTVAGAWRSIEK